MANVARARKAVTLKSKMQGNEGNTKSTSTSLNKQIENYKTRLEAAGQTTDKRNFLEKFFNLPEGQNALFDIFELIGRPQQALFGAIDAAQNDEDIWEGFKEGLGGSKKTTGGQLLRNAGMGGSGEFNLFDPSSYGELSASDVLGFGLDLFADPIDVPLFKVSKVGKAADTVGDISKATKAAKTADTVADIGKTAEKTKVAIKPFAKGSKSTLEAGLGLVGKGVKKTAKIGDNVVEKILGDIDAKNIAKYKDAVKKYGASAARDMYKTSDLLGNYKYLKKGLSSAVDYTKALPGNIIKKFTGNKNAEQIARIQIENLINLTDKDIDDLAKASLTKQGVKLTEDAITKEAKKISTDLGDFLEKEYKITNSANSLLSDITSKNKTIKMTQEGKDTLAKVLNEIPLAKGTYEITEDGIKFTDKFLNNKNTILKDKKFKNILQNTKIEEAKNYTAEQLERFAKLSKDEDFMGLVNKYQDNYKKASKIIKDQTGIDFSEVTNRPGYIKKAKGTISKDTESWFSRGSSSKSKSFGERKYASRLEAENALKAAGEEGKATIEKQIANYQKQFSKKKKAFLEQELSDVLLKRDKARETFNKNLSKLDSRYAKVIKNTETLKETKKLIEEGLDDNFIKQASKIQDTVLGDDLFKTSNKVMKQTETYNKLLEKFYNETLSDVQLNKLAGQIDKLEGQLKQSNALLQSKINRVKIAVDDSALKNIDDASKALNKTSKIGEKLGENEIKAQKLLEMKSTLKESYADRLISYDNRINQLESKLRGLNKAEDDIIQKKIDKLTEKKRLLDNASGEELFDSSYTAGLREFMNSSLERSTTARTYRDALLEGILEDPNVIKYTDNLEKLPDGTRKIPVGWQKINGDDIYKNIDSFKNLLPEGSDALLEFGNKVKGKKVYMPKEAAAILDVAPKITKDSNAFVKFVNGWNNTFKRFKTLTPGFHLRNITGNVSNMYLSGVPMKDIPVYYGKAISALNGADDLIRKVGTDGFEALTKAEQKQYKLIQEFAETGFFKSGSKIQELEDIEKSIKKGSKNIAKKGLDKVSEISMNMNTAMDNYSRMALYMYAKDNPSYVAKLGKESAADAVKFALFDPSNMTDFEKNVMRNVVPFYNFTKQNLLFQSSNIIKNTTKYKRLAKAIDMAYDSLGEDGYYQYQKEGFQIPTPFKDSKGNRLFMKTNLPLSDLGEFMENPVQRSLSSTTPIIKAPIEKVTGMDLFTGQNLNSKSGIERVANYLGINTITTDVWKKIKAIQNSNLSDNEKWAEILRSMLQNTNEEKVKNNKLYQEMEYYQNKVSSLKKQGIDIPTIKELTEQSKSNVNRLKKKRASSN